MGSGALFCLRLFLQFLQVRYQHIFFDLDRTLWDFETNAYHTLIELFAKHKLEERGVRSFIDFLERYKKINDEMWGQYGQGTITKEMLRYDRFHRVLVEHGVNDPDLSRALGNDYVSSSPVKTALFPFTTETLAYLSAKYRLYILTNGFEEIQHLKLNSANISHHFSEVITSERAGYKKPDRRMFEYALSLAKASPDEVLMVGDMLDIDIAGAREAGIDQVYFNPSKQPHTEKVTYEISCLSELQKLL
jgi:putative hydrolase of the HAD superfamily